MMIRIFFTLYLVGWLTALTAEVRAQSSPARPALLEGVVVHARTRQPIAGATVRATVLPNGAFSISTQTAPDGTFSLRLEPTQTYTIRVLAPGFDTFEEKLAFSDQRTARLYGKQFRLQPTDAATTADPLPTILFAPRQADLSPAAMRSLRQVAALLDKRPSHRIQVAGHTDTIGDIELNRVLARERAEAVRAYLVILGVAQERIEVRSYGGSRPLPGPLSPQTRAKNKRVEFLLLPPTQP